MADPSTYRDSTEIVLPAGALDGVEDELTERFTVSVFERGDTVRVIGSPVEIQDASSFLARQGITLP
ncbi:VNG_1110C family protein [Halarchaeum sp. P4]|uniref:VNG_1110C family protein n=1 Tax=Halarchaeum sp. P4 TaxID=3421639 RepID=UPI003EBBAD06